MPIICKTVSGLAMLDADLLGHSISPPIPALIFWWPISNNLNTHSKIVAT